MPPKVELNGSGYFEFVTVRIENEVGVYVVVVENQRVVVKKEATVDVDEFGLPEYEIVYEDD